ncbi:MAG TPA: endonuclease V, partial [Thermoguttaceae bacterium]|nr:endonuclease V [Thermoguttaceae bacterium]
MAVVLPEIPDLSDYLRSLWSQIPRGRVTTYGELARALGDPIASRWVGHYALHHDHDEACPCHRIVRADGTLGNYIAGTARDKSQRLVFEGVVVRDLAVDLAAHRFPPFKTDRPLIALRQLQESLADRVSREPFEETPKFVGGVDVSYAANGDGVAAYVLIDARSGDVAWKTIVRRPVRFPYITSYLSFRELPLLIALMDEVDRQGRAADVVLVDGTGVLHPRRAGIASHLGVLRGRPTIGLTKKLLCGSVELEGLRPMDSRPVLLDGEPVGAALRPTEGSRRPIFVSPGHR